MCSAPWYSASAVPRSATTAGPSASSAASDSWVSGERRVRRTAWMATMLPAMAPRTPGRWNGSFASGRCLRTSGRRAKISATRAGPRASRLFTSAARTGFRPDATFSSPSSVRTAHDQWRGPVHEHAVGKRHPAQADPRLSAHRPRVAATWRRNRTPSSRSSTAIRSSAEWISRAASSGSIVRIGKKP